MTCTRTAETSEKRQINRHATLLLVCRAVAFFNGSYEWLCQQTYFGYGYKLNTMTLRCAECECAPDECGLSRQYDNGIRSCPNCKADSCCCISIHPTEGKNHCCDDSSCKNVDLAFSGRSTSSVYPHKKAQRGFGLWRFFLYAKGLYATALGIEILCICSSRDRRKYWPVSYWFQCLGHHHCLCNGVCIGWIYDIYRYPWKISLLSSRCPRHTES